MNSIRLMLCVLVLALGAAFPAMAESAHPPAAATAPAAATGHDASATATAAHAAAATGTGAAHAAGHPERPREARPYSAPLIRTVLLGTLWLFIAAILLGPLVKVFIGDLWQRKTAQPFTDDAGHGGGHGHGASAHSTGGGHH